MNIYQKKIVKENDIFFFEDSFKSKNDNLDLNKENYKEKNNNLNIQKFYGINSKLLKKNEIIKNNRQQRSKSQIFSNSPIIENLIPQEIKTIIIKFNNKKEQAIMEGKKDDDRNIEFINSKTFYKTKFYDRKNRNNALKKKENIQEKSSYIENNDENKNLLYFFIHEKEKKHTRNKSVALSNNNENNNLNISLNTIYKKSYCIDKQNQIKGNITNKENLSTTSNKIEKKEKKLIKNISTPNIHNTIDLENMTKNNNKGKTKNQYIETKIYQNINNNNINNLKVQYDLSITPNKKNNIKITEILTSRNNYKKSNIKMFGSFDNCPNDINKLKLNIPPLNFKNNQINQSEFITDNIKNILSTKNNDIYKNQIMNINNRNQLFHFNKKSIMTFEEPEKDRAIMKNFIKNKINLMKEVDICQIDYKNNIIKSSNLKKCIYSGKKRNKIIKKENHNDRGYQYTNRNKIKDNFIKDENVEYNININSNYSNQNNQIKSIPLKLNNFCLFCSNKNK
jgi:hypothetical protein